jgi:hypothetical protein
MEQKNFQRYCMNHVWGTEMFPISKYAGNFRIYTRSNLYTLTSWHFVIQKGVNLIEGYSTNASLSRFLYFNMVSFVFATHQPNIQINFPIYIEGE